MMLIIWRNLELNTEFNKGKLTLILGGARSGKSVLAEKLAQAAADETGVLYVATLLPSDEEMRDRIVQHRAARPAHWRTVETPFDLTKNLLSALQAERVVLVDCLTVWTGNLMVRESQNSAELLETHAFYGEIYDDDITTARSHNGTSVLEPDREEDITSDLQSGIILQPVVAEVRPPDYAKLEASIMAELEKLVAAIRERDVNLILVSNEVGMGLVPPYPLGRAYRDLLGRVNQRLAKLADEVYLVVAGLPIELKQLQAVLPT